jgi:hypothetical protein
VEMEELGIQYADYAVWQREWLEGGVLEEQLAYWKEALAGAQALELPTDGARSAIASSRAGKRRRQVSREAVEQVKRMSRREGVTLFMSLLAGVKVVLMRYSGQSDISVGTPIAGRREVEVEGLIGLFVNTLVMRTEMSGGPTFREVLRRVREVTLGAYGHQDVPFEKVVEEVEVSREMSRTPLFDVMVALQNGPGSGIEMRGMKASGVEVEGGGAKFDLSVVMSENEEGMMMEVEYREDRADDGAHRESADGGERRCGEEGGRDSDAE